MATRKDPPTVKQGGGRLDVIPIDGVKIVDLTTVLTRSGVMLEVFRTDLDQVTIAPRQVNWVQLAPGAATDWHRHEHQIDHLVAVEGNIKLALWDDREHSPTRGASMILRMGIARPAMAIVPPGVFHALRNESGLPAGYINVVDQLYIAAEPDNWRLPADSREAPDIL